MTVDERIKAALNIVTGCCHFNENGACIDHKGGRHVSNYCSIAHQLVGMLQCEACGATFPETAMYWHHASVFHGKNTGVEVTHDEELFADHSVALEFVREIAAAKCLTDCGGVCIRCRADAWLHTARSL